MNSTIKFAFLSAALAALALPGVAQSSDPTQPVTGQSINQRKDNQQERIGQGVASGQLTAGEAKSLEKNEQQINREERDMRQDNGGKLTQADKQTINQQQNALSNKIYTDKHNSVTQPKAPRSEVGQREFNQQQRIAQGAESGQLTAGEAKNLESKEARINNEVRADRAANGGKLTAQEKAQVNRQQNRLSNQIYKDKHNNRKR